MSDVKLWNIAIVVPTTCSATFQEITANIGDTIHANFTWNDAIFNIADLRYAAMSIIDPSGVRKISYFAVGESTGTKQLEYKVEESGTWTCEIDAWQGIWYITATDDLIAYGVMATLMATSEYYSKDPATDRPFIPLIESTVCSLDIQNTGNVAGKLMWQIYSFAPSEKLEAEGTSVDDYAGEGIGIWNKPIQITIPEYPDEISMQLGVKVKGPLEAWPTWQLGLATGNAKIITLENGTLTWVGPAVIVAIVGGLLGTAYYMSKH